MPSTIPIEFILFFTLIALTLIALFILALVALIAATRRSTHVTQNALKGSCIIQESPHRHYQAAVHL